MLLSKLRVNVAAVSLTLPASSGEQRHDILDVSRKERIKGNKASECGVQVIVALLPIDLSGNLLFYKSVSSLWKCRGVPFCSNSTSSILSSPTTGTGNFSTWDFHFNNCQVDRFGN
jgi:hypothetical protein